MIDDLVDEFRRENANTRLMLERVPEAAMGWKPHPKSWTMGELASHLAENPTWLGGILDTEAFDMAAPGAYTPFRANGKQELMDAFDANAEKAVARLASTSESHLAQHWQLKAGDEVLHEGTRLRVIKETLINHAIQHRGQLTVYLRLNDVPVPGVYGPSADEAA